MQTFFAGQGEYHPQWEGPDQGNQSILTGIYIARLETPEYSKSIKMVLLK